MESVVTMDPPAGPITPRIEEKKRKKPFVRWTPDSSSPPKKKTTKTKKTITAKDKTITTKNNKQKKDQTKGKNNKKDPGEKTNKNKKAEGEKTKKNKKDKKSTKSNKENTKTNNETSTNITNNNNNAATITNTTTTTTTLPEQMLDKWDDEDGGNEQKFLKMVVLALKDIYKQQKETTQAIEQCVQMVCSLQEDIKKLEVEHISAKASDADKSQYWQAATRLVLDRWSSQRKFPHEYGNLLELAQEAQKHCALITHPEHLSKMSVFKVFVWRELRQVRYIKTQEIHAALQETYEPLKKIGVAQCLGKGRRTRGKSVEKISKTDRHKKRAELQEIMQLDKEGSVREHAEKVLGQVMRANEKTCETWTPSDKFFAHVIIEFLLRVKGLRGVEARYKAIKGVEDSSENDPNQARFEYSDDDDVENDTSNDDSDGDDRDRDDSNGEDSDGEDSDGEDSDGEDSDGEDSNGEDSEGSEDE